MEKSGTAGSRKTQGDSLSPDQDVSSGDGGEVKKEPAVEKSEEDSIKNEGTPGNQKRERNSSSTTPKAPSRSTRSSNNPEFVAKQRHFLQKVNQGVFYQSSEEESDYSVTNGQNHVAKRKRSVSGGLGHSEVGAVVKSTSSVDSGAGSNSGHTPPHGSGPGAKGSYAVKKRKYDVDELSRDIYCWVCHREMGTSSGGSSLSCEVCPRVYHARCCHSMDSGSPHPSSPSSSSNNSNPPAPPKKGWACPECVKIVRAETMGTRSRAMQLITMDQLCTLLKFVLIRVRAVTGAEPFYGAVDLQQFPRYREFVANPMDLGLIDRNIRRRTYGSTEAFFADMKWLVHNSIIFNTQHSKLTSIARSMLKICRQELMEIENCPDCYSNAHTRKDNWFIDVCRRPHILVWAKLKGFPHWPAKAMRVNKESCVDVRFFGAHDRAWVPARDCFLYSREMPAPPKNRKKNNFDGCIMEVEDHIKKLKERFGAFVYAPLRTVYDPSLDEEILMKMLPKHQPMNLDSPSSGVRENLQEDQISRESPSMSTGTEEESDRDQSMEEEPSSQKRDYDPTFEDSMEMPGGACGSQPKESIPSSTQPAEDVDKAAVESESEAEGSKNETAAVEMKRGAEEKETKNETEVNEEGKGIETVNEEESKGVKSDVDLKEAENELKVKETKSVAEEESAKGDKGVVKVEGGEAKSSEGGSERGEGEGGGMEVLMREGGGQEKEVGKEVEGSGSDHPQDNDIRSAVCKEAKAEEKETDVAEAVAERVVSEAEEGTGKEDEKEDKSGDKRDDELQVDNASEISALEESDVNKSEIVHDSLGDVNAEQKSGKEEVEEGTTTAIESVVEGASESVGEEKGASKSKSSSGEEREENAKSASEEADNPIASVRDESLAQVQGKGELEKHAAGITKGKENSHSQNEKRDKAAVLGECGNDESAIDQLNPLIDHKMEPEKCKLSNSTGSEDETVETTPSVDSVQKQKLCGKISSEKSCDKTENDALDRDGEENKVKLFQSLRLVNIETLYKHDVTEATPKKSNVEVEEGKKDDSKTGTQLEIPNKIDVNKLRESLMTKCANTVVTDLSHSPESTTRKKKKSLSPPSMLTTEAKHSEPNDVDLAKKNVDENMDVDPEGMTDDQPAKTSVIVTSPASNKGDVGSQLRVLGKLQQRLSFIKETTSESDEESVQEKDENTAEDADSVMGDASGTSNSDDEEPTTPDNNNSKAEKEGVPEAKSTEKGDDVAGDVDVKKDKSNGGDDVDDMKGLTGEGKIVDQCLNDVGVNSDTKSDEENFSQSKAKHAKKEKVDAGEDGKVEKFSSDDGTTELDNEHEKPTKSGESNYKEGKLVQGKTCSVWNGKPSEMTDSGRASPMISKRQKNLEDNDSAKTRASPLKTKPEEVIEEEVLNREVLKESNMVVVQKTVKTRRLEDESSGGSAPKRARKSVAQTASVVERCESPAQDEVFPSMFLDPSVTITVLQEAEKENGGNKEQSSSSVEELRTSVNLSNDVSLTMVRGTGALEGLAAMQDGAVSKSSELQEVDTLGQNAQKSSLAPQFRPRARKSFPRPSPRVYARSPQTPTQLPNMEVRRLSANSRDASPVNLAAGSSLLKTAAAPSNSVAPVPAMAMRGGSAPPPAPFTPMNSYPTPTFSTPSTSHGLVQTVVSPVMPSSLLVSSSPISNCASPRLPNLSPRPPNYPLSGHQSLFTPSEAGPVSAEFNKHAQKLSCYMRQAIEDILGDLTNMGNTEATIKSLRLEVEKLRWEHAQEKAELKHNHDLVISEIKTSLEKEKMRLANDVRRQCEAEKLRAIEETKRKQWCANCSKEALFYCCWNTSYCDYPCQQTHWPRHMASCAQNNGMPESGSGDSNPGGNRKDGSGGGHRGGAVPPPPFHQLQRPGSAPLEAPHPEEEYYDEDSSSPPMPRTGTSGGSYRVKRRRCGVCKGCLVKDNCGNCAPCRNSKTHQVCRMRRCRSLQSDWPSGSSSRTVSPEPGPNSLPLETPPLTHASKQQPQEVPASPLLPLAAPDNEQQFEVGDSLQSLVSHEMMNAHLSQSSPYGGTVTSKLMPLPSPPKGRHQDSALNLPWLQVSSNAPGLPSLHIQPNFSGLPKQCSGNEQGLVARNYSPAAPSQKQLQEMKCRNDQNSETCISQALVPYATPSKPLQLDSPVVSALKVSRSRKGHPQRSRNHNHPTRNTYLQPPHFICQLSSHGDQPFNAHIPEMSHESQSLLPQSFPPMSKSLMLQTEKTQVASAKSCPQSPYLVPHSHHLDSPFISAPLGSGDGPNYSNITITPIPNFGLSLHHDSPPNDGPKHDIYYSPSLPRKRNTESSTPEEHMDTPHFEGLSSRVQLSEHQYIQMKHDRHVQRGSAQHSKSSGDEIPGLGNAHLHLPKSNLKMHLGSQGHPLNAPQNPKHLATLPPNFYPQTALSHCGPTSSSQPNHVNDSFLKPYGKPNGAMENLPLIPNHDARANRNTQNAISLAQNQVEVGGLATNFLLQPQDSVSQPPMTNLSKFDNGIPKKYSKHSNSMDHLPNFNATFLNQGGQPDISPQSAPSSQGNRPLTPPKYFRLSRKSTRKHAGGGHGESSRPQPTNLFNTPPMFKFPPPANFCNQINCPHIGCNSTIPPHPVGHPNYPENGFAQPGNPFPMNRYPPSPAQNGHRSHPQPPAGSQQNAAHGAVRGSCMAILSATSIIMPPPQPPPQPPNFLFPPPFDMEMLVRQHQLHRQQMGSGVNVFSDTLRNSTDRARKV